MSVLLILIALILLSIAVWQVTKIFELSQRKPVNTQIATPKDNDIQGKLLFVFLMFLYLLTIYSFWAYGDVLLPQSASEHGVEYDRLMWLTYLIIFIVQIITQALLHYFSYRFRGKDPNQKASYLAENDRLEFWWTVIPVIVLAGIILYGLYTWTEIMTVEENDDALIVELYAQQFNWKARYAGKDGQLGDANVRFLQDFGGLNLVGIDATDPNGMDDIVVTELHLPVNREVIFKMRSQDVLHSAYMPHFRAQMNTVPGMITEFAYTPTLTTVEMRQDPFIVAKVEKINQLRESKSQELIAQGDFPLEPYEFDYLLLCNKICGASHYNMQMKIIVETEEEFQNWLDQQPTFAQTIQ
ncbi:MAG: cytochrome c oxidase subunit II [Flavobacteriaceae bacterium]|nr:cytochrome c oxidase subunit II [Flavobacteriaceae bacterium]MCY4266281.1 cytochrome c oxidase subunit II [Flavobacteriaceae bacterium]